MCALLTVVSGALYLFTNNPRYLNFAWRMRQDRNGVLCFFVAAYQSFQGLFECRVRQCMGEFTQVLFAGRTQCRRGRGHKRRREANLHAYLNYSNLMPALLQVF